MPPDLQELLGRVRAFVEEDVLPAEAEIADRADVLASWHVVERLRDRARERGIYTPHLPEEWGGLGVGVLGMALISQECGVSGLASLGLNAMAPDEGNMHTLLHGRRRRSSSRPTCARWPRAAPLVLRDDRARRGLLATRQPPDDRRPRRRRWVINGRKWCITGGDGAAFAIVVAKTGDDDAAGHRNYSLILVPTDTPGWEIDRHPEWLGSHSPGGHPRSR